MSVSWRRPTVCGDNVRKTPLVAPFILEDRSIAPQSSCLLTLKGAIEMRFLVKSRNCRFLSALGLCLAALLLPAPAMTQNDNDVGVLPPNSRPLGKTYGEWSAAWWQFVFSIQTGPTGDNPLFDRTGSKCDIGQSGNVFFLVGAVLGSTQDAISRTCTVPRGRFLFFPIMTLEDNVAEEAQNPIVSTPVTADKIVALLDCLTIGGTGQFNGFNACDGVTRKFAEIDGREVDLTAFRATSPVFSIQVPPSPNLEETFFTSVSGKVSPVVADGYYLMLAPLSIGNHTIRFGGTYGAPLNTAVTEITYHLSVR